MVDDLPRRPFAVLPPEPGGFEEALARGRRRRRRTTGTGVLASVVAIALAVSLSGTNPDTDAQLFVDKPPAGLTQDETAPRPDGVDAVDADQLEEPAQPDDGDAGTIDRSSADGSSSDGDTESGALAPRAGAGKRPVAPRGRRVDPPEESIESEGFLPCKANSLDDVADWCLAALHTTSDPTNGDAELSLRVCLSPHAAAPRTLQFRNEQQVDFVITRQGSSAVVWQWAHRAEFRAGATSDVVTDGDCRIYTVVWPAEQDNDGYLVPRGAYTLRATSFATQLDRNFAEHDFTLT